MIKPFIARPRLTGAILAGAVVGLGLAFIPNPLRESTRVIFAWDATLAWFITSTLLMMRECDETRISQRAAREDEGQHVILGLAVAAAAASVVAIAAELSLAKTEHGLLKGLRVALAFGTVLGSWLFVQMVFALRPRVLRRAGERPPRQVPGRTRLSGRRPARLLGLPALRRGHRRGRPDRRRGVHLKGDAAHRHRARARGLRVQHGGVGPDHQPAGWIVLGHDDL
jgi:hypothetical protein